MSQTLNERKSGNIFGNYPPALRKRRKPTRDQDLKAGSAHWFAVDLGKNINIEALQDFIDNQEYYEHGLDLIASHYGIERSYSGGVVPAPQAFWFVLALRLLQHHVNYFKPPGRRGPKATLQPLISELEVAATMIKEGRVPGMTIEELIKRAAKRRKLKTSTIKRERTKLRKAMRENSKK
jgi:hypothetical protein